MTADLKADSKSKLRLYNEAKALDGEIHFLEEREQVMENEVESSVQGLTKVELSLAKWRSLLTSFEKKTVNAVVALVVTDIISALVLIK